MAFRIYDLHYGAFLNLDIINAVNLTQTERCMSLKMPLNKNH